MKVNSVTIREASNGFVVEHVAEGEYDKYLSEFVALDIDEALAEQPAQPYKGIADHINQATNGRMRIDPVTGDVGIGTPSQQPAQRPWVGLTHEDIVIILNNDYGGSRADCIRAAEARLKERNT